MHGGRSEQRPTMATPSGIKAQSVAHPHLATRTHTASESVSLVPQTPLGNLRAPDVRWHNQADLGGTRRDSIVHQRPKGEDRHAQ
jgi:hypothetical protein